MNTLFDTMPDLEKEYQKLVDWYQTRTKNTNGTGVENVLQFLLDHPDKTWWFSWELIGKTNSAGGWLSHRAPARASDLAIHYPDLVEDRKIGRYSVYRLRSENITKVKEFLNA